jgi:hypothetical protein
MRFSYQNGKSRTEPNMANSSSREPTIPNSSSPVRPSSSSRRDASPTRRSSASREELLVQLEESKRELKRRNQIEKEFQEVGEGLRKLAVEREGEIEQLQSGKLFSVLFLFSFFFLFFFFYYIFGLIFPPLFGLSMRPI